MKFASTGSRRFAVRQDGRTLFRSHERTETQRRRRAGGSEHRASHASRLIGPFVSRRAMVSRCTSRLAAISAWVPLFRRSRLYVAGVTFISLSSAWAGGSLPIFILVTMFARLVREGPRRERCGPAPLGLRRRFGYRTVTMCDLKLHFIRQRFSGRQSFRPSVMNIESRTDSAKGIRTQVIRGDVRLADIKTFLATLYLSEKFDPNLHAVWDVRAAVFREAGPSDIKDLAYFARVNWAEKHRRRTAVVVAGDFNFGLSRMLEQYVGPCALGRFKTFRDPQTAVDWLAPQGVDAQPAAKG